MAALLVLFLATVIVCAFLGVVLALRALSWLQRLEGETRELRARLNEADTLLRRVAPGMTGLAGTTRPSAPAAPAPRPAEQAVRPVGPAPATGIAGKAPEHETRPVAVAAPPPSAAMPEPLPVARQSASETPKQPVAQPPAVLPPPPRFTMPALDWESLVGVKLFSWIAGIALALAGFFFISYSIQQGWLSHSVQMAVGILVGLGLLAGCEMKVARSYTVTANALDAAGIVILFSTFFAAFGRWYLLGAGPAFICLVLVTAVAVLLSLRRDSVFIAILGLLGGFLVPALLSTGQDNPVGLFGYLLLLNAGLAWVAYRRRWAVLTIVSLVLTTVYQWSWVGRFLTEAKLPIAIAVFLVFPVLGVAALMAARPEGEEGTGHLFARTVSANAMLPALFAVYMAAVPQYGAHAGMLFGFLLCLDAGLFAVAVARGPQLLHAGAAFSTSLVLLVFLASSYTSRSWPLVLFFVSLFVLFYLAAPLVARRLKRPLAGAGERAALAAPVLLFVFPSLVAIEPAAASPALAFTVLFVLVAAVSAFALRERMGTLHFIAAFFALAAEAVWSSSYLTDARLLSALLLYVVFAFFYIGLPVLARRLQRPLEPQAAGAVVLLVSLVILFFPAGILASDAALWGLALLLAILNAALFIEGASIRVPAVALAATILSWLVLGVWWSSANLTALAAPGLLVVSGFTLLTLAGHVYNAERAGGGTPVTRNGIYLGLVGHLFLLFVATRPALSIPPWPMLAILFVLDLAIATSALYVRQAELHLAAVAASAWVLIAWLAHAHASPWPLVAVAFSFIVAAIGIGWMRLAREAVARHPLQASWSRGDGAAVGSPPERFLAVVDSAAAAAIVGAEIVAVVAARRAGAPAVAVLTLVHIVLAAALLTVASFRRWHRLALVAVAMTAVAVFVWQSDHTGVANAVVPLPNVPASAELLVRARAAMPPSPGVGGWWLALLGFASGIYAVFLAYPVLLGRRARTSVEPHLAVVLASAAFFLQARSSLLAGGLGDVIGVLPVGQAALMGLLLVDLLRRERPGGPAPGRLALVAGAALAFVTVAIPMQLDKQWITVGWALEAAALAWLYRRIPHRGLLVASAGLAAAVFVRLALNPQVFVYHPRGGMRVLNWYLYTYLVSALSLLAAARLFSTTDDALSRSRRRLRLSALAASGAVVLLFLLLNIEIADYYSVGPSITFNLSATLAQDMTYTLGWAVFAVGLLVAGIATSKRAPRIAALGLLVVTVLKGFLHDLGRLGGMYRVVSFVGLAICLALVAVVLQKYVFRPRSGQVGTKSL
jgi:uncharacterized membrane protein